MYQVYCRGWLSSPYIDRLIASLIPDLIADLVDVEHCALEVGWVKSEEHPRRPLLKVGHHVGEACLDAFVDPFRHVKPKLSL